MTSEQRHMVRLSLDVVKHAMENMTRRSACYLEDPAHIQPLDLVQDILDLQVVVGALTATFVAVFGDLAEDEPEGEA